MWAADQARGMRAVAAQPRVVESVAALAAGRPAERGDWVVRVGPARLQRLRITDSDCRVSPRTSPSWSGGRRLLGRWRLHVAPAGGGRGRHPADCRRLPLPDARGVVRVGSPTQFVCAWILAWRARGRALLPGQPADHVQRGLRGGPGRATGEAYSIDREGQFLSPSRSRRSWSRRVCSRRALRPFSTCGPCAGRAPVAGRVRLSAPPRRSAHGAGAGVPRHRRSRRPSGGAPRLPGHPVVGAAQWLPALDIGLVVTRDVDEAWASLRYARRAIVLLGGVDGAAARRHRPRLLPLPPRAEGGEFSGSLERMVQERTAAARGLGGARPAHPGRGDRRHLRARRRRRVTFVNPAACADARSSPEAAIGQNSHTLFHHSRPDGSPYPKEECPMRRRLPRAGGPASWTTRCSGPATAGRSRRNSAPHQSRRTAW